MSYIRNAKMKISSVVGLLFFWTIPAMASNSTAGAIVQVVASTTSNGPNAGGVIIFSQQGTRSTRPACATMDRWVIGANTPGGQAIASTLLTAYISGKKIIVQGTGSSADWSDTESVNYFLIVD